MEHIIKKNWVTGSGRCIDFYELLRILKICINKGSKIFIGTDSFTSNKKVCFASAVCLHGGNGPSRYFFYKEILKHKQYNSLVSRILEETKRSVELACFFVEEYSFNSQDIELHLDVSPFSAGNATSKFSDMLKGYVQGYGLEYKLKPDAWASQSIADKHSK